MRGKYWKIKGLDKVAVYCPGFRFAQVMSKKKIMRLQFSPSGLGDWMCPDGEVESCVVTSEGVWIDPDVVKGLGVGCDMDSPVVSTPENPRPAVVADEDLALPSPLFRTTRMVLCCHHAAGEENIIMLDTEGHLGWAHTSAPDAVRPVGLSFEPAEVKGAVAIGDFVVLLTSGGPWFLRWHRDEQAYKSLGRLPFSLPVEFALVREAVAPYSLFPSEWPNTVVSVPTGEDSVGMLGEKAAAFLEDYERRCREASLFTSPFLVMAAWRLADGSHIPLGNPVVMIPNSEAPTVAVETSGESASTTDYTVRVMGRACSLYLRLHGVKEDLMAGWEGVVTHLDIMVTRQVSLRKTYIPGTLHSVLPAGFSHSVGSANLPGVAGLPQPEVPEGNDHRHYPGFGDSFTDLEGSGESQASTGSRVSAFSFGAIPSVEVEAEVRTLHRFRVMASSELCSLGGGSFSSLLFTPVTPDAGFSPEATPEEGEIPDFLTLSPPLGEAMSVMESRLAVFGGEGEIPTPSPVRTLIPFSGNTTCEGSPLWSVTMEAEVVKEGQHLRRRLSPDGGTGPNSPFCMESLPEAFPRWLFYPDREAVALWLEGRRGNEKITWRIPLLPHPHLDGAFWFRGFSAGIPPVSPALPEAIPDVGSYRYPARNVAAVSVGELPFLFRKEHRIRCGGGSITGIVASVRSLSSGRLGEFPLQVLASDGIWAVGLTDGGGLRSVQQVSLHGSINCDAVVPTPHGTIFCSPSGVKLLQGTKVEALGKDGDCFPSPEFLLHCRIWYDMVRERCFLFEPGRRGAAVYSFKSCEWKSLPSFIASDIAGNPGVSLLTDSSGNVYSGTSYGLSSILPSPDISPGIIPEEVFRPDFGSTVGETVMQVGGTAIPERWWLLTLRPLKLTEEASRVRLRGVKVLSSGVASIRLRLWGAMHPGDWHPLAEGKDELRSLFGSGWRCHRIQLLFRSKDPRLVEALLLRF